MSDLKLGQIIEGEQQRDAIHVAVAPVTAAQILAPGEHVGFVDDDHDKVGRAADKLGIVDPYLTKPVFPGQRFWLFLYPQTITSLRHDWTHPAFARVPASASERESRDWIRSFAQSYDVDYQDMLDAAREWIEHGSYFSRGGLFEGENVPSEFWRHYEVVTGTRVDEGKRESFFSCAC